MNYRKIKLDEFGVSVEVGVVSQSTVASFLSKFGSKSIVNRADYENYILESLVKNYDEFETQISKEFEKREADYLKNELVDKIYEVNTKLDPKGIVLAEKKLMHVSDALKKGYPTSPTLPATAGWAESVKVTALVDGEGLRNFLEEAFDYVKTEYPDRDYRMVKIEMLDAEIPILDVSSTEDSAEDVIKSFIERCEAGNRPKTHRESDWAAHLVVLAIPLANAFLDMLNSSGYLKTFSRQGIMTQIYIAITQVNPSLIFEAIDWDKYDVEIVPLKHPPAQAKGDPSRKYYPKGRSSKQEAAQEKKRFVDVSYERIINLETEIKKQIKGQDPVIKKVTDAIKVARVIPNEERPVGCFLLTGTTGVGKTEFAKVLAQVLTDRECIRVDCSEYQHAHEVAKILGSPPGYVGHEGREDQTKKAFTSPTSVAGKLKKNPFSVLLFDEIEKADEALFHVLLQIMDEARITSGGGETVRFRDAIILLTSNIGTKEAEDLCSRNKMGFGEDDRDLCKLGEETILRTIKERFKPEFRNRLTDTIVFDRLSKEPCREIVDVCIDKTKARLEEHQKIELSWTQAVQDYVLDKGYDDQYGARHIKRTVYSEIEIPLANYLLEHRYQDEITTDEDGAKKIGFDLQVSETVKLHLDIKNDELFIDGDLNEKDSTKPKRVRGNRNTRK